MPDAFLNLNFFNASETSCGISTVREDCRRRLSTQMLDQHGSLLTMSAYPHEMMLTG